MFEALGERLEGVFSALKRRGALREADVDHALGDIRTALLEADVALPVVKDFIAAVRARAIGQEVLRSVTPGQQVVKIVHDILVETLGAEATPLRLGGEPPAVIMMIGLQGSGKTTSSAKLALHIRQRERKKVLLVSLDVARPAAQEQLRILGEQTGVPTLPVVPGQQPVDIARRAVQAGRMGGHDVVILDTAGRLQVDDLLMRELEAVRAVAAPAETLLVADAMTGQDAVATAEGFHRRLELTGIILTRTDGDARGGAALSMRQVTGCPVRFLGTGEKTDALEPFQPDRVAGRILGMGDVVSLVEKAGQALAEEDAARLERKMRQGRFDLEDMATQLRQMRSMGGMQGLLGMLPGGKALKGKAAAAGLDDRMLRRQEALINAMTPAERRKPDIIHASRKRRIAAGSGLNVQDVNKLLKQYQMMAKMTKRVSKLGEKGFMRSLGGLPRGGGLF